MVEGNRPMDRGVDTAGETSRGSRLLEYPAHCLSSSHSLAVEGSAAARASFRMRRRNRKWEKIFQPSTTAKPAAHTQPSSRCG